MSKVIISGFASSEAARIFAESIDEAIDYSIEHSWEGAADILGTNVIGECPSFISCELIDTDYHVKVKHGVSRICC